MVQRPLICQKIKANLISHVFKKNYNNSHALIPKKIGFGWACIKAVQ